jgi:nucleotide-binding universal stress UspA family protein
MHIVTHTSPPEAVLEEARNGYDIMVIGMNARWGLRIGTINLRRQRVLAESPVSVLAVHPPLMATAEHAHSRQWLHRLADSPSA